MLYTKYVKRLLDLVLALVLALSTSPVMFLSAIAIKLEDPEGPVLFRQERVGEANRVFTIYKFRSMIMDTERDGHSLTDRERMLRVGGILRKTSIDELPQLFNIIRGEMSFIGPRPLPTVYLPYYDENEVRRHDVKPGLTGWAQVNGRNTLTWEEKFNKDLEYVDRVSMLFDLKIAVLTIVRLFRSSDIVLRGEQLHVDFHQYRRQSRKNMS